MRTLLAVITAVCFAGSACAADLPVKAQPVAPATSSWTGWYVGINGGGAWGDTKPSTSDVGPDTFFAGGNVFAVTLNASKRFHNSGGLAGGQIGYLYQSGFVVLGVEAGFDWMNLNGSSSNGPTVYPVTPGSFFTWNLKSKTEGLFTLLGRVGIDMGSWYPYVTGGVAVSHVKYSANFVDTFYPTNNTFTASDTVAGPTIGGGIEWRFAPHWLVRGEYLYADLGEFNGTGRIACTPGVGNCVGAGFSTPIAFKVHLNENIGRLALGYQF